jgi:hypothetical protein
MNCPDFEEACQRFRAFLLSQGWPERILWIRAGDIDRTSSEGITVFASADGDGSADARLAHEEGWRRALGVLFHGICVIGDATCATVAYPANPLDAELKMYPSEGGLKMSVAVPRADGRMRWPAC